MDPMSTVRLHPGLVFQHLRKIRVITTVQKPSQIKESNADMDQSHSFMVESEGNDKDTQRIRLCSTAEDPSLPCDSEKQPAAISCCTSLILSESSTIRRFLHSKRSNPTNFDPNDKIAYDSRVSQKPPFFLEERVVYIDKLVKFAASFEGHSLGIGVEARAISRLTPVEIWQGVYTWVDWIAGNGICFHQGKREDVLSVGLFLGAKLEYLEELMGFVYPVHVRMEVDESRQTSPEFTILEEPISREESVPSVLGDLGFLGSPAERDSSRGTSSQSVNLGPSSSTAVQTLPELMRSLSIEESTPDKELPDRILTSTIALHSNFEKSCTLDKEKVPLQTNIRQPSVGETPAERAEQVKSAQLIVPLEHRPRIRIYITFPLPDEPFDDPRQPLHLEMPEKALCKHSSLFKIALSKKRTNTSTFDPSDEMIYDPQVSQTRRKFTPPFPIISFEGIILNLINPSLKKSRWIKGEARTERMKLVKSLLYRNPGELWDALKTWIVWIREKKIVLFEQEEGNGLENAINIGVFLGTVDRFLEDLEEFDRERRALDWKDFDGEYDAPGNVRMRNAGSKPSSIGVTTQVGGEFDRGETFDETDKHIIEDLKEESRNPNPPKPYPTIFPVSCLRTIVESKNGIPISQHGFYKGRFGMDGGPLSQTRSNECNQVIEDGCIEKRSERKKGMI
ncbi:hypothetical protein VTL71DRAFT_14900 [Oculimacula yallundae]|uniref:Uncharacterized protein n=1 Tax=Oculimacula yallundae TaxID=86028 RepID=A0ABR4CF68_9HELO